MLLITWAEFAGGPGSMSEYDHSASSSHHQPRPRKRAPVAGMASTPNTSFSSEDLNQRGRQVKSRAPISTPSKLPSPSETEEGSDRASEDTCEAIEHAYQVIWDSFCGQPAAKDLSFDLRSQRNYERLYQQLSEHPGLEGHFDDEIRKDWNATSGRLTLRLMPPSPVHDIFGDLVKDAINKELDRISEKFSALQPFRHKIVSGGTARIRKRRRTSRIPELEKSPDAQWHYSGIQYPAFVLEVAYSEDEESLLDKVKEFFACFQGDISSILGFDITYPKGERRSTFTHNASLTLWTSQQEGSRLRVQTPLNGRSFRADGHAVPGDLILPFKLFVPLKAQNRLPLDLGPDADVRIAFANLCNFLEEAERHQNDMEPTTSPSPPPEGEQGIKRVTFEDEDGSVTWDAEVSAPKRRRVEDADVPLGRTRSQTRSQTRSVSQTRRSSRLQGQGT